MNCLKAHGHSVDLQILDNKSSAEYRRVIEEDWNVKFQLVPTDVYRRNAAERVIQTFKDHFISVFAGVDPTSPKCQWDPLLDQTKLILNLLHQSTLDPSISDWE